MAKKLLVALALEGKLQGDGLQSMDDDDDLLTAMARELVARQGVGALAAEVWKNLQAQRGEVSEQSSVTLFPPDERPDVVPDPDVLWSRMEPTALLSSYPSSEYEARNLIPRELPLWLGGASWLFPRQLNRSPITHHWHNPRCLNQRLRRADA
jgi:hypothetical protein